MRVSDNITALVREYQKSPSDSIFEIILNTLLPLLKHKLKGKYFPGYENHGSRSAKDIHKGCVFGHILYYSF